MSRFYVPEGNKRRDIIHIDGEEAYHLVKVMRMKAADDVVVFDGTGSEYSGIIEEIGPGGKTAKVRIVSVRHPLPERLPELTLAQAVPKKKKMEYIVEKATELGVHRIIPLMTERTIIKPSRANAAKMSQRWERIGVTAAKQCGRSGLPKITAPVALETLAGSLGMYDIALIATPLSQEGSFRKALTHIPDKGRVLVIVGPEGGFSEKEVSLAESSGCRPVSLGRRILKSDTAGLFVLSVLNYVFLPES